MEEIVENAQQKKKRVSNFTESEKKLLVSLANNAKTVIECKKTDACTWKEKEKAWKKIEEQFLASTSGPPRSAKQLKNKYELIKKELKKRFSFHKTYSGGTGGGPYMPPPTCTTEEEKILAETIALRIEGIQSEFDSDAVGGIGGIDPGTVVCPEGNNDVVIDYVDVDWSTGNTKLLQTPKCPALRSVENYHHVEDPVIAEESVVEAVDENKENTNQDKKVSWTARRRPVLLKKKSKSSASAQFEILAAKKLELVEIEKIIAEEKLQQQREEFKKHQKILDLQIEKEQLKIELLKKADQ